MFCPYCGNFCAEAHKFCYRCGKPLPELPTLQTNTKEATPPVTITEEVATEVSTEEVEVSAEVASETLSEPAEAPEVIVPESSEPEQEVPATPLDAPAVPAPQPKKGRLWPPLVLLIIMACIGLGVFFADGSHLLGNDPCFTIENGTLYFDYSLYTGPDELTVPATVNGITVTAISDGCFADCDRLTTVILPDSVTKIGVNAFSGCDALRGLYIPSSVTTIGAGALAGCSSLEAIYFPASIKVIGAGCLDRCDALQFIIYDGTYDQWLKLYNGSYPSGMELHTNDGVFYAQP